MAMLQRFDNYLVVVEICEEKNVEPGLFTGCPTEELEYSFSCLIFRPTYYCHVVQEIDELSHKENDESIVMTHVRLD